MAHVPLAVAPPRSVPNLSQLWLNHNHAGHDGTVALGAALGAHATPALQELDLTRNGVGAACSALARGLSGVPILRILRLGANNITEHSADELRNALRFTPQLEVLDLGGNPLGSNGTGAIARDLGSVVPALRELNLRYARLIGAREVFTKRNDSRQAVSCSDTGTDGLLLCMHLAGGPPLPVRRGSHV